jgi:hypothetical protein
MKQITFAVFGLLCVPCFALASVRVNEIAWMGTSVSSSNEWIELYNDGDVPALLSGFTLSAEGVGKLSVPLSGNMAPKSFFFLERTNDDTVPGILADQIYTGVLGNSGETLLLKDGQGTEVQRINASSGWPAGDNTTKETMQWNGSSWITAKTTPKAENILNVSSATTPPNTAGENKTTSQTSGNNTSSSSDISAHSSPLPLSDFSVEQELFLSAGRNRIVPVGGILAFEAYIVDTKGKKMANTSYTWSFGDGFAGDGLKVSHVYEYPGNYIVVLNVVSEDGAATARAKVRVFAPDVTLSLYNENEVALANHSSYEMNIGGWKLNAGNQTYVFPGDTLIGAKEEIVFPSAVTKFQTGRVSSAVFMSPNNKILAYTKDKSERSVISVSILSRETVLQNMKTVLDRVASDTEDVRRQLSTTTAIEVSAPSKPKRNTALYQYATAVDLMKPEISSDEKPQTITLKKPEGFFSQLWHFFF